MQAHATKHDLKRAFLVAFPHTLPLFAGSMEFVTVHLLPVQFVF